MQAICFFGVRCRACWHGAWRMALTDSPLEFALGALRLRLGGRHLEGNGERGQLGRAQRLAVQVQGNGDALAVQRGDDAVGPLVKRADEAARAREDLAEVVNEAEARVEVVVLVSHDVDGHRHALGGDLVFVAVARVLVLHEVLKPPRRERALSKQASKQVSTQAGERARK